MAEERTVLIVDDHEVTRIGLELLLKDEVGVRVIGHACDGREAIEQVQKCSPSLVLMDISLRTIDGITATQEIKKLNKNTRVLMLTSHQSDEAVMSAFQAGADGYVLKDSSSALLRAAITAVLDGAIWADPALAAKLLRSRPKSETSRTSAEHRKTAKFGLSEREMEVLRSVVDGLGNQEIADKLSVSLDTIKTHIKHILEKLLVSDRTQAAVKALREGLV
ncbi:MAG: response regulator transcription factor [Candidatus Obscuribacterales bacterium]|nr:response regulator transcription factor [Candidatus Obscuribacterales bacterium]